MRGHLDGFTPLAGVPMGTRSGDIDYAAAEYIARKEGMDVSEMLAYLNKKCGMLRLLAFPAISEI